MVTKKQFAAEFAELVHEAGIRELCAIDFTPEVRISPRSYADVDPSNLHFRFAPEVLELPRAHRRGLIMHEIGHVLCPEGSERDADRAAEEVFGVAIKYDCAWPGKGLQRASNPKSQGHHATAEVFMTPEERDAAELEYEDWLILSDGSDIVFPLEDKGYKWVYVVRDASAVSVKREHVIVTDEMPGWDLLITKKFIVPSKDMVMIGQETKTEFHVQHALRLYGDGDIILAHKEREDWAALIHRATRPGVKWQGTRFDTDGPSGHIEGETREGVLRRLIGDYGFNKPDPGAMRRVLGVQANPPYSGYDPVYFKRKHPKDPTKIAYQKKRDALNVFLDWNRGVVDDYGGPSMKHSAESFEAINHRFDIEGKRRVDTIAKAVWWSLSRPGGPYYLADIDVELLNRTAPVIYNQRGLSFSLPDYAEEQRLLEKEQAYWEDKYFEDLF